MSNQAETQMPWWRRGQRETLADRVAATQNVNDQSIVADDVQRRAKLAMKGLLAFTMLLSAASYFKFFEKSFGFYLSILMALILAAVIEFGKNWGLLKVLRTPFFLGWRHIWREVQDSIMWVSLLLLSIVTFAASFYNSTAGAHQLSLLLSHERTYAEFVPNTTEIDNQIAAVQKSDAELGNIKRKGGKTNWAVQPMKESNAKTLASLQQQRETTIAQQRADWEKQQALKDSQNKFSAGSLMAVGGWVELLQIILMFVRVAAERSLDKTASSRGQQSALPYSHLNSNGTERPHENNWQHSPKNRTPIGFFWKGYGETPIRVTNYGDEPTEKPVSQSPPTVTQANDAYFAQNLADDALRLAMTKIQGHAANFDRKHGKNATTAENIHGILDKTLFKMKGGFRPSGGVHAVFSNYVTATLFPLLRERAFRYPKEIQFEGWLRTIAPHEQLT